MSRELPRFPNLEHLKSQAKVLLGELRRLAPNAKLADAQRVLARQYGFPSWPKLKAHVERLEASRPVPDDAGRPAGTPRSLQSIAEERIRSMIQKRLRPDSVFVRYTESAQKLIFFSAYEAQQRGSPTIGTEHLLLGLVRVGDDLLLRTFERSGTSLDKIRTDLETRIAPGVASDGDRRVSAEWQEALKHAAEEADGLGHREIQTPHFLLGLMRSEQTVAAEVLAANGMRLEQARKDVAELIGGADPRATA
jgi:Clp amino terminal domain, pathogenicity island component